MPAFLEEQQNANHEKGVSHGRFMLVAKWIRISSRAMVSSKFRPSAKNHPIKCSYMLTEDGECG